MFVNKHFMKTGACISQSKQFYNAKPSAYYFYMRTKILLNFGICVSVPLSSPKLSYYQQWKQRTGVDLASLQFLIYNGHANVIRHLRNFVFALFDLPSLVLNYDDILVFFSIPWHQWSQNFKIVSPIKSNALNI